MTTMEELKFRSVCDACSSSKVKCSGTAPCERCFKKGIDCHYRPFKNRRAGGSGNEKQPLSNHPGNCLEAHERLVWTVFFTLYKNMTKSCSQYWFHHKLLKMIRFLENRSDTAAFKRLQSWIIALKVTLPLPEISYSIPHFTKEELVRNLQAPMFQETLDDLREEAKRRNLPILDISDSGVVEANDIFLTTFDCEQAELQQIVDNAGGGFLPWGGDVLAKILCSEQDLITYLQMVSMNVDALGRPQGAPLTRIVPTLHMLHIRIGKNNVHSSDQVPCIVKAVQCEKFELDSTVKMSTTLVIDIPSQTIKSKARPFSETNLEQAFVDTTSTKKLEVKEEPLMDIPIKFDDFLGEDDRWLENLLSWVDAPPQVI